MKKMLFCNAKSFALHNLPFLQNKRKREKKPEKTTKSEINAENGIFYAKKPPKRRLLSCFKVLVSCF